MTVKERQKASSILAINEHYISYKFLRNTLREVNISANKVIEMRRNGLLNKEKLNGYTSISIVHGKEELVLPIVEKTWKYGGQKNSILKVSIDRTEIKLTKEDFRNWLANK